MNNTKRILKTIEAIVKARANYYDMRTFAIAGGDGALYEHACRQTERLDVELNRRLGSLL